MPRVTYWLTCGRKSVAAQPVALLFHGFGGSVEDFEPLAGALAARGFAVRLPPFPGHHQDWEALRWGSREEWRKKAEIAVFSAVHEEHAERVVVIGHSLGALLALDLALRFPLAAVVLLAPALWPRRPWASLVHLVAPASRWILPGRVAGFVHGMREVLRLMREVRRELAEHPLERPLLIVQGEADAVVAPRGALWLYDHVRGANRRLVRLPGVGHDLVELVARPVIGEVVAFVEAVLS